MDDVQLLDGEIAELNEAVTRSQEGYVGLLRAIGQFDPEQRKSLAPFARSWIRQSLQELQADFLRPMRLPRAALRDLSRLKTERDRIVSTEHREPGVRELAARTGIALQRAEELIRADRRARSLSEPKLAPDAQFGTTGDLLADPSSDAEYDEVVDGVAERLGLSVNRVRRIQRRALSKLARAAQAPVPTPTEDS